MLKFIIVALTMASALTPILGGGCQWDKDSQYPEEYPPLVMDLNTWKSVYPSLEGKKRTVRAETGRVLVIACPGNTIKIFDENSVEATCVGDQILNIHGEEYTMVELGCSKRPKESLEKLQLPCGQGGEESRIGFTVSGYAFYELFRVCFDKILQANLYSTHLIRGSHIGAKDNNPERPGFKTGKKFYTVSPSRCYSQDSQDKLMISLLHNSSIIDASETMFFARGHASPDSDFVTEQEQDATYYYINAVPQWQIYNNGNWRMFEDHTRDLAEDRSRDLQVWTGGWRVLELEDINSNGVDIYLGLTDDEAVIPAPDVMWKVVYDPITNEAAAIMGDNTPYVASRPPLYCGSWELCSELRWLRVDTLDMDKGLLYCCTVQELAAAIPNAPQHLGSATLLTH